MTREEAIKDFLRHYTGESTDMAIKALSAEPCDDAISRQDTCTAIIKRLGIKDETFLLEAERVIYQQILAMPPVQPIRPKGEWLFQEITNAYYVTGQCSRCTQRNRIDNFCPNCGADMRGEGE